MPRCLPGILLLLLVAASPLRAQGDVALFRIDADSVSLTEAEYYFHRSAENDRQTFLPQFIAYKVKVRHARELGLDTAADFSRRRASLEETLTGRKPTDSRPRSYEREWVKLAHVTYRLKQHAGKYEEQLARRTVDSVFQALQQGADIRTMGEELPWMQTRHLLREWQEQLSNLEKGHSSKPFHSPLGMHVIVWLDKRTGKVAADNRPAVDTTLLKREAEEGLLVAALEKLWAEKPCTEDELAAYFKRHRVDYGGGIPHFQGAVIHCLDKKQAKAIRKYLKKYPQELWREAILRIPSGVADSCRMEEGLFRIGQNPNVDKLVFGCGTEEPLSGYPYRWVMGKKLKKGPVDYRMVRSKLEADCRKAREKAEVEALKQKYRVEINEEVLKTVNNIGNK